MDLSTYGWLLATFVAIALGLVWLHRRARVNRVLCCALCLAACACAVAVAGVLRWMPQAYRPVMHIEALPEEGGNIWLRNAFSITGDRLTPGFPRVVDIGAWTAEDGLRWQAGTQAGERGAALEISVPAAQRYALFFGGNRQTGKALLTYPSGESEVVDTRRDSDAWEVVVVDIGLDGSGALARMRRDMALAFAGCVAASALLFAVLYPLLRRHRAVLGGAWRRAVRWFERKLLRSRLARGPLNARRWGWALFGLCVLFAIPLMIMAFYARPAMDDYIYGMSVKAVWQQTGSLIAVVCEGIRVANHIFATWQGTYGAMLLTALQPGVFGDRFYAIGPLVLISSLIAATCFFSRTVLGKKEGMVIGGLVLFLSMQFVPGVHEAFYWFAGGVGYTFFYSLSLVLYALVLRAHRADASAKRIAYALGACLFAVFVGSGNYVTALLSCVLLGLLVAYRVVRKDRRWWIPATALLLLAGTLLVCASAPGNAARQAASIREGMPSIQAVWMSFPHALAYLARFVRFEYLLGLLIALPFLYRAAERSGCAFRYPLAVTLLSFCAYACQFTPHLVAYGIDGPDRMMAIIYYVTFWLIGGNCFYWCGWLAKRRKIFENRKACEPVRVFVRWTAVAAACLLAISCAVAVARNPEAMNGASAASSLLSGQAARYGEALAERSALLEDQTNAGSVEVEPLPRVPRVLQTVELLPDPYWDWLNGEIARYYGKEKIVVLWPAE